MFLYYVFLMAIIANSFSAPVDHAIVKRQILNPFLPNYARPPTGVQAGPYGGMFGSPIFGMPFMGPFNSPAFREARILELFDELRILNNRTTLGEQFILNPIE